jgi:hypothetical protein
VFHPFRSRLRDLHRRLLTDSAHVQPARVEQRPNQRVDLDGPTEWRPALHIQPGGYRAVRVGARNGAGTLYRSHRAGFNNNPGPRPRSVGVSL